MVASLFLILAAPAAGVVPLAQIGSVQPEAVEVTISVETQTIVDGRNDLSPSELVSQLTVLAENGDGSAAELLGEIHQLALFGVAANPIIACNWYKKVAGERADSAHNLATCFYEGRGRGHDYPRAREWYQQAADRGWLTSWCGLGNMLVRGEGGPTDIEGGMALCERAANAGDRDAQTDIGSYLIAGKVVPKDIVAARRWLELAAEQEQANALFILGQIHSFGDGTPKDLAMAELLWRRAYAAGRTDAAFEIARVMLVRAIIDEDGEQRIDRENLPEIIAWAERAAQEDTRDEERARAQELGQIDI